MIQRTPKNALGLQNNSKAHRELWHADQRKVELDLAEELQDEAHIQHAGYQQQIARCYNQNVRTHPFNVDDLELPEGGKEKWQPKFMSN